MIHILEKAVHVVTDGDESAQKNCQPSWESSIYTIIRHKSVHVRKLQVAILAQSFREMSLTDRILPRYILSRVRVSVRPRIFLYAKKPQTTLARIPIYARRSRSPLSGQINNLIGNDVIHPAL